MKSIKKKQNRKAEQFSLYDLKVVIIKGYKKFVCSHKEYDFFEVQGENLLFPKTNKFSMYSLAAILPLLPAKQRNTHENDWMTTDSDVACPDPNCGAIFRIIRLDKRTFNHSEVTIIPLKKDSKKI